MKYSEFKNNVKLIGFETKESNRDIYVERIRETVISVSKEFRFGVDTGWTGFSKEQENVLLELYANACELAKTPLTEREEEKRYYLRYDVPPLLRAVHVKPRYLYKRRYDGYIDTSFSQTNDSTFKVIFTESEIAEMDITGFEKEEVTT